MTSKQVAIRIVKHLSEKGFEAYLAGGCVRDMLLGKTAKDYDVATNAQPKDVVKLFKRTLQIGAKFGVVIVLMEGQQVEVATFRSETGYADGRHPGKVEFTGAKEDASRRDFTINGMFYDPLNDKVIDYVAGQSDLKKSLIRTIGEPDERFNEDYLRMLRAIRFSTRFNFKIEPKTWAAVCRNAGNITKISGERICMEIEGILAAPNRAKGAKMLIESGLAAAIFPGFTKADGDAAVKVLDKIRKNVNLPLALAGFFGGAQTQFALDSCKIIKLSNNQAKHIKFLLDNRGVLLKSDMSLASLKKIAANPYFEDLYEYQKAIERAKEVPSKKTAALIALRKRLRALGNVDLKPKPLLNGNEIVRLGAVRGPSLGQLIDEMYIAQLEGILTSKDDAQRWVRNWLERHKAV